jgi:3-oxoacyl-(acyl-carrier-protein) synthase
MPSRQSCRCAYLPALRHCRYGQGMQTIAPAAVITGCGALSPFGGGVPALWRGLLAGASALGPSGGVVPDFDAARALGAAAAARLDRLTQFALAAAGEAIEEAGLDLGRVDRSRCGVIVGTTIGGMLIGERYRRSRKTGEPFAARQLLHFPYHALANRVARELGVRGPVVSPSIACASGTQAVGLALELVRRGQGDLFLAGGAETACEFVLGGFTCLRATTRGTVRPFDVRRDGLLLGEGAAVLVIESAAHARARGARPLAAVLGTGLSGDAVHMTAPARDGAGAARAMRAALADAGVAAEEIDFVSAHGTGTVYNDAMEVAALRAVFGATAGRVPLNSIKGAIGHTLGAAGAFEAIMATRVLAEGLIPPTANCDEIDPGWGIDVVRGEPRRREVRRVLSTSSAFAGNNAAVVLGRAN